MRLLNIKTHKLESFDIRVEREKASIEKFWTPPYWTVKKSVPPYAILSHTWGPEEILFDDMKRCKEADDWSWKSKKAFKKFHGACDVTEQHGLEYVWIDPCCIDKSSSAELSEAINSMFQWYLHSDVCLAYIEDATNSFQFRDKKHRWLSRGWTLQELIAPQKVEFYGHNWELLGDRSSLASDLAAVSGIDTRILADGSIKEIEILKEYSIAHRMQWMRGRSTRREEDMSYCLMGIFDVNMPLLYGEGNKAFQRLQDIILKACKDQSILCHRAANPLHSFYFDVWKLEMETHPILALSVEDLVYNVHQGNADFAMGFEHGRLIMDVCLVKASQGPRSPASRRANNTAYVAMLDCFLPGDFLTRPALLLAESANRHMTFWIKQPGALFVTPELPNIARDMSQDLVPGPVCESTWFFQSSIEKSKTIITDRPDTLADACNMIVQLRLADRTADTPQYSMTYSKPEFIGNFLYLHQCRPADQWVLGTVGFSKETFYR